MRYVFFQICVVTWKKYFNIVLIDINCPDPSGMFPSWCTFMFPYSEVTALQTLELSGFLLFPPLFLFSLPFIIEYTERGHQVTRVLPTVLPTYLF